MLQRSIPISDFEILHQQNSTLRDRLRKMSDIEPYVQILLQNNKQYQHEINQFQIENHRLRCKIDQITQESLRSKESHASQTKILKNNFQSDIDKLIRELKEILKDKDSMQNANQLLVEQLQTKYRRDIQTKRLQKQELQREFHNRNNKMGELLRQNQRILEQKLWEFGNRQTDLIRQIEKLGVQKNMFFKDKTLFEEQVTILQSEKQIIFKKNKELQKQNQQISKKWLKSQQEKTQTILQLKDSNKSLMNENQQLLNQAKVHQKTINELNRRVGNLTQECEQVCSKNSDIQINIRKLSRAKIDLEAEHKQIIEKLSILSQTSSLEIQRMAQQIQKLFEQNKSIYQENVDLDSDCKDKNSEISDLLRTVEKLQIRHDEIIGKNSKLEAQNSQLSEHAKKIEYNLQQILLENKNQTEKALLYTKHNQTLQKMLEKEKHKNLCHQTSRHQIQNIAMGTLNKPQEICKEYEMEIQKLVRQFVNQRKQHEQNSLIEMNTIKVAYENALRQKEQYFNHKIIYLEKQLNQLRRIN